MIKVENLHKSFGDLEVLKGVSEHIKKGEVVSVIGASGSGKSTFLRCLNMLEEPESGSIIFEGVDITQEKVNIDVHRQKMGMIFQHFNVFPHMTVLENITLAPTLVKKMDKAYKNNGKIKWNFTKFLLILPKMPSLLMVSKMQLLLRQLMVSK